MEKRALITAYAGERACPHICDTSSSTTHSSHPLPSTGEIEGLKARLAAQIAKDGVYLTEAEHEALQARLRQLEYELEDVTAVKAATEEEAAALRASLAEVRPQPLHLQPSFSPLPPPPPLRFLPSLSGARGAGRHDLTL